MPRIIVLNNYPLDVSGHEVGLNQIPDQLLWGINYFKQHGFDVEIAPFEGEGGPSVLDRVVSGLTLPVGDITQQNWVCNHLQSADLIYSPCQTQVWKLALMRALGRFNKPIVCLAHHPVVVGRLGAMRRPYLKAALRGIDAFPSLSNKVSAEINELAGKQLSTSLTWAVDSKFYPAESPLGDGVITAGRTARDLMTFGQGAQASGKEFTIICLEQDFDQRFHHWTNAKVLVQPNQNYMGYPELLKLYAQARAIAIPLWETKTLHGLTALMDALGMGKPVIMTRNALIDLDIEKEGVGVWIDPGDAAGWTMAIEKLHNDPQMALEMGKRARSLAEGKYMSQHFANAMVEIFQSVLKII